MTNQVTPVSETLYIPALLRRVSQGTLKIPAFQRNLVWKERDVLELLESIYKGYPIGSLLFWLADADLFHSEKSLPYPTSTSSPQGDISWVIDGMQRISSLYGVFNWESTWDPSLEYLNVYFDLDNEEFFVPSRKERRDLDRSIALSSLFISRRILDEHKRFLNYKDADILIEKSINLQSIFQEYLIPTVTLQNASVEEVVIVFERINNTGIKLNISQFMRAITWSRNFDLDEEIEIALEKYDLTGFNISHEVFTKAISIVQNRGISPSEVAKIREKMDTQLRDDIDVVGSHFRKMSDFLIDNFKIYNYRFLPYEGQALFLFKMILSQPSHEIETACKNWVWRTSFSETLRGKPDDHIQQHLNRLDRAIAGDLSEIDIQFTLIPERFLERKYIYGAALTMATSSMFAVYGATDPYSGRSIQPSHFMEGNNANWFRPILPHHKIEKVGRRSIPSARVLANLMLVPPDTFDILDIQGISESLEGSLLRNNFLKPDVDIQFIDDLAITLLRNQNYAGFLLRRAELMATFAASLAGAEED